jgi:hypothetical protein
MNSAGRLSDTRYWVKEKPSEYISGKMLKTIRNAIVGMMNILRMVRSLHPRAAAREPESSVARTATIYPP